MQARSYALLLCLPVLGLSACAVPPSPAAGSRLPTYSTDLAGKAPRCTASPVSLEDGKEAPATLKTGGGGWCGISVRRADQPYGAALLVQPSKFGAVYVHTVGDDTRVDYTPRAGASGADSFAVKFIPGDATMRVIVDIDAPPPAAAPAAPAKAATPAAAPKASTRTSKARTTK